MASSTPLVRATCSRRGRDMRQRSLHRLALGIARESAGGDAAQHFTHLGRTGKRVLVEVEAQRIAAAERRVILLHRLHARARGLRMMQRCVSFTAHAMLLLFASECEWLRRGRRALRPRPAMPLGGRARAEPCAEYSCTVMSLTKSLTLKPPRTRAMPPVGNV